MSYLWKQPTIPASYWIRECIYKCSVCGNTYGCVAAYGDELVKFVEDDGNEIRWLPTYEPGGYLELLETLVPGFRREQQITMPVARAFEAEFKNIQEPSLNGKSFHFLGVDCRCTKCSSKEVVLLSEKIIESPPLNWLKYRPQ